MFKFFWKKQRKTESADAPQVLSRQMHALPRQSISDCALKVLRRLQSAGFEAYLVGGGVRDLLLKRSPKDFDVATSARPEEIKRLFRNCRLIGRRFRLAHIYFPHEIIEVSTFRAAKSATDDVEVLPKRDNEYGTLNEDRVDKDHCLYCMPLLLVSLQLGRITVAGTVQCPAPELCTGDLPLKSREGAITA